MTKRINYNLPDDALSRLPAKTIVTRGDKLALLRTLSERAGSTVQAGTNRVTLAAIEADVRAAHKPAKKDSAPVRAEAPLEPESRTEQRCEDRASIAQTCLERKIELPHGTLQIRIDPVACRLLITHESICALTLTHDQADQFADALAKLADDLRQDANARAWSQSLLEAATG